MPLYDYLCEDCGPFCAWVKMAEAEQASACPNCNALGARQMSTPNLNLMNTPLRRALVRAEKTSDEPRVVSRKHLDNCGCSMCNTRRRPPSTARRWMIGH